MRRGADVFEYLEWNHSLVTLQGHEKSPPSMADDADDRRLCSRKASAAARQLIRLLTPEERHVATALLVIRKAAWAVDDTGFVAVRED